MSSRGGGHHVADCEREAHDDRPVSQEGQNLPDRLEDVWDHMVHLAHAVFGCEREEIRPMTPERVKSIRGELKVSQEALAQMLRLGPTGKRTVARWEAGDTPVPGPVSVALEALESGWCPGDGRWSELRQAFLNVLDRIDSAVAQARAEVRSVGSTDDGGSSQERMGNDDRSEGD